MLSFFTPSLYSRVFMIVLYALIIAVAGQITSTLIIGSCNYVAANVTTHHFCTIELMSFSVVGNSLVMLAVTCQAEMRTPR